MSTRPDITHRTAQDPPPFPATTWQQVDHPTATTLAEWEAVAADWHREGYATCFDTSHEGRIVLLREA